jgi:putative ABC transport system ATP-binding protein
VTHVVTLDRVTRTYGEVRALDEVTYAFPRGRFVAVMGPSGSGKTTLLNCAAGLDPPTSGSVVIGGVDLARLSETKRTELRRRHVGFVFQSYNLLPRTSAIANVELPLLYARESTRRRKALEALTEVGLADRAHHLPTELSGGQQQRVAIARALVTEPSVLLADEPTGNLDTTASGEIARMLVRLSEAGRTIVLITHEEEIAAHAKRVVRLRDGRIVSDTIQQPATARGAKSADSEGDATADARAASRR